MQRLAIQHLITFVKLNQFGFLKLIECERDISSKFDFGGFHFDFSVNREFLWI